LWLQVILFGLLLSIAGCGDDDGGEGVFDCPDCAHWTKLIDGNIANPGYKPGTTDVLAFNSDRGTADNTENIWIVELDRTGGAHTFHQITDSPADEFDPAWSPDGTRLAYTAVVRDELGRPGYELFMVDVTDFRNPGDALRLTNTDFSDEAVVSKPSSAAWLDDETILYSDGQNIFELRLDGSHPAGVEKIINDPSDFIFSGTDDFIENQPAGLRLPGGGDLIFFVSDSRVPLGAIHVESYDAETEDTVSAEIHLEGVPTGVLTPSVVGGRPLGIYMVGASVTDPDAEEDYCDTLLASAIQVFENDTTDVGFHFSNPRGLIRLLARPLNSNFYYDGVKQVSIRSDTTLIECVYPGLHEVKIVSIEATDGSGNYLRDSIWVSVAERQDTTIVLDVSGHTGKRPGDGFRTVRIRPERAPAAAQEIQQDGTHVLWGYDSRDGSYARVSAAGEYPTHPSIDPTGSYLAYVVDFDRLKIVGPDGTSRSIRLPGAPGVNICFREAAFPSWSSDGSRIVVSVSPCTDQPSSDHNSTEYDVWEVETAPFLPR
jgi:hypothetical protein